MEITKAQVDIARSDAESAYTKYHLLKEAADKAEKIYLEKLNTFKDLDYKLALVDGRLKKLPPSGEGRKEKKQPELTLEQIQSIAANLGIKITIEEEDHEIEEMESEAEGIEEAI